MHGRVTHFIPQLTGKYTNGIEYFAFHDLDSAIITDVPINVESKMKHDVFHFLVQEFRKKIDMCKDVFQSVNWNLVLIMNKKYQLHKLVIIQMNMK